MPSRTRLESWLILPKKLQETLNLPWWIPAEVINKIGRLFKSSLNYSIYIGAKDFLMGKAEGAKESVEDAGSNIADKGRSKSIPI